MKTVCTSRSISPDELETLNEKLVSFYTDASDYTAFLSAPDHSDMFAAMLPLIENLISGRGQIKVLELGAGLPSFPKYFSDLKSDITYHVQDITPSNQEYLQDIADSVFIGDISNIPDNDYDLIFSLYVFEHVVNPSLFLSEIKKRIRVGGYHIIIAPRYDTPGYVCPSLRHIELFRKLWISWSIILQRLQTIITRNPSFLINMHPAVFEKKWHRDSDAVHLVSYYDICTWCKINGFSVEPLRIMRNGLIRRILGSLMTLAVICKRDV